MSLSYGVTPDGYVLKTLDEINADATDDLTQVVDPVDGSSLVVNFNNQFQTIALILAIALEGVANGLLVDQAAYNQFDLDAATGQALASLAKIIGIRQNASTPSTVSLDFTGTPLATIPSSTGVLVTDINETNNWLVEEDIVFDGSGDATDINATCETTGAIAALPNSLNDLVFGVGDITTVTNPNEANVGTDVESDSSLRRRSELSTEVPSIGLPAGLQAALLNVDGVIFARVYNNVTLVTDANGIPPKAVSCVVVGGDDDNIFDQIISRNNTGATFGNTSKNYIDQNGNTQIVYFERPVEVPIYIIVNLTVTQQDVFPTNGATEIQENIVSYTQFGADSIGVTSGFNTAGFPPGADISVSRLYTPINSVPGHTIDDVFIGILPSPTLSDDITIAYNEVGQFEETNIIVNVVFPP